MPLPPPLYPALVVCISRTNDCKKTAEGKKNGYDWRKNEQIQSVASEEKDTNNKGGEGGKEENK